MRIKRTIEETIDLPEGINLEDLQIQERLYDLVVKNQGSRLELQFYKKGEGRMDRASPEFAISIREGGVSFERYAYRPKHDHDDTQYLIVTKDKSPTQPEGKISWNSGFPHKDDGKEFFLIQFGSVELPH